MDDYHAWKVLHVFSNLLHVFKICAWNDNQMMTQNLSNLVSTLDLAGLYIHVTLVFKVGLGGKSGCLDSGHRKYHK